MNLEIKRKRPRIELVPMIDVMFFMLVFFMLFSTINGAQTGIPIDLPKALHLGDVNDNTLVISINSDSQLYLGKQSVSLGQLRQQVGQEMRNNGDTRVIIRPDAVVPYKVIVDVMDTLAEAGVARPLLGVDRQQIPNSAKLDFK